MQTRACALVAIAALSTPAATHADGTATWLWDVTTQDGDATVEPGETATITLSLLMELNPGDGPFLAFAAAVFDVVGNADAYEGSILGWQVNPDLTELTGDLTTTDGSSLYNINAGQLTSLGPFNFDNPIDVMTFEWAPCDAAPLDVTYVTSTYYNHGAYLSETDYQGSYIHAWEGETYFDAVAVIYPVTEAAIQFTVIPDPPAAFALVAGFALTRPRRRT